jgi:hypothetical protein
MTQDSISREKLIQIGLTLVARSNDEKYCPYPKGPLTSHFSGNAMQDLNTLMQSAVKLRINTPLAFNAAGNDQDTLKMVQDDTVSRAIGAIDGFASLLRTEFGHKVASDLLDEEYKTPDYSAAFRQNGAQTLANLCRLDH